MELRPDPKPKIEMGVTVDKKGEKILATLIDISQGGFCLMTDKVIFPGTAVDIMMNLTDNYAIHGIVGWALLINKEGRFQYQLGIEADQNHVADYVRKNELLETAQ